MLPTRPLGSALSLSGNGQLILSGSGTFADGTTVISGTLVVANLNALEVGASLTVGDSGAFTFDRSGPAMSFSAAGAADRLPASVTLAAVPEPSTLALLAAGALVGEALRRRRKRPGVF